MCLRRLKLPGSEKCFLKSAAAVAARRPADRQSQVAAAPSPRAPPSQFLPGQAADGDEDGRPRPRPNAHGTHTVLCAAAVPSFAHTYYAASSTALLAASSPEQTPVGAAAAAALLALQIWKYLLLTNSRL